MTEEPVKATFIPKMFCWVDLSTGDTAAASAFYQKIFGWTAKTTSAEAAGNYTMLDLDDRHVGGLYEFNAQMREKKVPPHWMSYILVEDADQIVEAAQKLGATVFVPPLDVMEEGRMAVLQDPTGAPFAVWQARQHAGADITGVPGAVCWQELLTHDVESALKFYTQLFGWDREDANVGTPYCVFKTQGRNVGGMLMVPAPDDCPSSWLVYFAVADCDATVSQVKEMGGNVCLTREIPTVGRIAVFTDPQGAAFAAIQPDMG